MNAEYEILLPTFNGETFLPELIDSCLQLDKVSLSIRDDGSTDHTVALLWQLAQAAPEKMQITLGENLGVKANVSWLLERVQAPYFLLADQDDIWEKQKLNRLAAAMRGLETHFGTDLPLLVWSDASLIDEQGKRLHPSLFAASGIPASWCEEFRHSLIISNATGCTMLGNRALARCAVPIPDVCYMHDWWLLLVAQAMGHIAVVDEPLVRYRQHKNNILGANVGRKNMLIKMRKGISASHKNVLSTQTQAREFFDRYSSRMKPEEKKLCHAWACIAHKPKLSRLRACLQMGFKKPGFSRGLAFWAALLLY